LVIVGGLKAAVEALQTALAGLAAEPAAAEGSNAKKLHTWSAAWFGIGWRTSPQAYQVYKQPWLFSSFGGGASWYCIGWGWGA
jgi:hypothetical protein